MTPSRPQRAAQTVLVLTTGVSLGLGFSGLIPSNLLIVLLLLTMASFGEWLEVRLGQLGGFTLRPVVAFIGLWNTGPASLMIVGLVPIFLKGLWTKGTSLKDTLVVAGMNTLGFWLGYLVYLLVNTLMPLRGLPAELGSIAPRVTSFLTFWTMLMLMQGFNLSISEGIRLRTVVRHLHAVGWVHATVLTIAAIALSYVGANFGYIVMGIAGITLIEAYYPWKLLGEQSGVLLTSLQMMAQAVDLKDPYTSNHSQRVSRYAVRLARTMGVPEDEVERIRIGGLMHDLGKIGISGRIIRKPGKLTPEEQAMMRQHSSVSADIIKHLEILGESAKMVRHHHENYDGSGYPDGLKGEEIPLASRVIFVADAFDALVTDRPYRKGATREEALEVIRKHAGTQFDRNVVEALERIVHLL
jgi:putative nucleotidyltransferase with HDIG domain